MEFKNIELRDIRPFVRLAIRSINMLHTDYVIPLEHRIVYCIGGEADFWVGDEFFKVKKNDMFYISAGVPYKMEANGGAVIIFFYFDLTFESSHIRDRKEPVPVPNSKQLNMPELYRCRYRLCENGEEIRYLHIPEAVMTVKLANKLWEYFVDKVGGIYGDDILSGMMITLISMILMARRSVDRQNTPQKVSERFFEYIHSNYSKKISIDDIAEAMNYHKSYLNRCVKKQTGQSLYKYLISYRLEQAMEFLMYTDISVSAVAEKVGFSDPKGFATAFKNYYGIPPSGVKKYKA